MNTSTSIRRPRRASGGGSGSGSGSGSGNIVLAASFIVIVLLLVPSQCSAATSSVKNEVVDPLSASLNAPASMFLESLRSALGDVSKVLSIVSQFGGGSEDFRLSNAIDDCVDLLDLSSDEISWTISASESGKSNKTSNLAADMKTSLSAAFVNQDTCIDGFQGTNSFIGPIIAQSITQLTSIVRQALNMVQYNIPQSSWTPSSNNYHANSSRNRKRLTEKPNIQETDRTFPTWIRRKDRRLLQPSTTGSTSPHVVVAKDGTGNFTTIMDAVHAAPNHSTERFMIYVKKGVYDEIVEIKKKKMNIMIYGDGMDVTVITGNRSFIDGWTTYRSATVGVSGAGFIARDLTIQNTAGPEKHQAVAFRSDSDLSAIYRCAFRGYQDTLYTHSNRQFFRECTVTGTVDFIFGDAVAVLQGCTILARKGLPNQKNTVTAQGRKDSGEISGFSIHKCNISADEELMRSLVNSSANGTNTISTYLGRPWKMYSRTVVMESYISEAVRPEGWLAWDAAGMYLDTLYYAEYMNSGPGAGIEKRVDWPGFHLLNSSAEALNYTVARFIEGDLWLPQTGVKFSAGLGAV